MRHALRLLLCTGLLAGLFAPLTWAQSWPYIYTYANLSRAGGSVYAYASSQLAYPYYQCDGQMQYQGIDCWASYTSYAQAILLKDGGYRGSSYASFWGNPSQASVSADVDVGEWQLQTEHRIDDLEWADAYDREWFIWRYDYLYNYDYRQLTLSPEISISGEQTVYDGTGAYFQVTPELGTPTSYQWSFDYPSGAGNGPNVNFGSPNSQSTTTDARWFAHPDGECSASGSAIYDITATVGFQSGSLSDTTMLDVVVPWQPAGITYGPTLLRYPYYYQDGDLWRVSPSTFLVRTDPARNDLRSLL